MHDDEGRAESLLLFGFNHTSSSHLAPLSQVLEFPVQMLIRFWVNHHLLDIFQRPLWRVVKGRSRTYVDKLTRGRRESGV